MDCKTCKGTGHIEFERGAVVKNCPHCKGTGSAKFIALCDALITPIIKERNEARAERDALRAQVEAMQTENESARRTGAFWKDEKICADTVIDQLRVQVEAMRADADRFRFVFTCPSPMIQIELEALRGEPKAIDWYRQKIDACIALQAKP